MSEFSVVIAPDSFKGSLPARGVADALGAGWRSVRPGDDVVLLPLADGGEGTLDAFESAVPGAVRRDAGLVSGPDGRPTRGEWLRLPDGTAVIELAQASGLPLMEELDALGATTVGLGEVIRAALGDGATRVVIGLGGSASTDGGAGALAALGLTGGPASLSSGGASLLELDELDRRTLLPPPRDGAVLLTDVNAPLLGERGAAAVFGPQKGASPEQVDLLDAALARFASLLGGDPSAPGAGAAGGTGYGFAAAWGAVIEPGADFILRLAGAEHLLTTADVVLSGEGRFDASSLTGKLVGRVLHLASAGDARLGVIAGALAVQPTTVDGHPVWSASLTEIAGSTEAAMAKPARWLFEAGASAARELASAEVRGEARG